MESRMASRGQIGRIVSMLVGGEIRFDEAQAIIDRKVFTDLAEVHKRLLLEACVRHHDMILTEHAGTLEGSWIVGEIGRGWSRMLYELLGLTKEDYKAACKRILG